MGGVAREKKFKNFRTLRDTKTTPLSVFTYLPDPGNWFAKFISRCADRSNPVVQASRDLVGNWGPIHTVGVASFLDIGDYLRNRPVEMLETFRGAIFRSAIHEAEYATSILFVLRFLYKHHPFCAELADPC